MNRFFKRTLPALAALMLLAFALTGCNLLADALIDGLARLTRPPQATETPAPTAQAETPEPTSSHQGSGLIPMEEIFAPAEYTAPSISADGKRILFRHILPDGSADSVVVRDMETGRETAVPYPEGVNGIPYFEWSGDGKHVLFMVDNSGDENYGIYSVDIATGESRTLVQKDGATAYIVALDERNPDAFFYQSNGRDPQAFDLYWCDGATGETELVMENPGYVSAWYFDHSSGFVRIAKVMDEDGGERLLLKRSPGADSAAFIPSDWQEIVRWPYEDVDNSGFLGFSADGKRIHYVDSAGRNTAAVMEMDLATGKTALVDADPVFDVASAWHDLRLDRITAVRYARDRSEWKALESGIAKQLEFVSTLSGGDFGFASTSRDDRYWLIWFDSDTQGRSFYFVDSVELKGTYLFHESPSLKKYGFASMEPFTYEAADGLTVHGYATFPPDAPRNNLPAVLYVHGGPKARDVWGFNGEVQWLANRGYLVLQVNFRGSTGYGKQFVKAGDREWGGKMQQDLTDAVQWAVGKGYADRSRVAIMGGSYGGYAALAGAAFTPDVYACAIDMFGPSSLITLVESVPAYWKPYLDQMHRNVGDPAKDAEFMKSRSPLYHAGNIKIPVLIAQGGNDVRVKPQESEQMVAAMKERGLDVQYRYYPDAGHGFNSTEDYIDFFSEAGRFLAEHIGGKS